MNKLDFYCGSEEEQMALGACLAQAFADQPLLVFLDGDLGAGKTTLVRGFLRGLGYKGSVRSPTYTLVEPYSLGKLTVFHLDLYRLCDPEELEFLGGREIFSGSHQVMVEWPEKGEGWLPEPDIYLLLHHQINGRSIEARCDTVVCAHLAKHCTEFLSDAKS
ncbi:MAG TPA: tRNA (adenosine(37)-N6)-threonylcarbamoyltransferase complex ATPase subunit type 1 TsaE [Thiolapillus brandeum]|uniref:tRNA threonylcarbamoyladenosine biosynthesis protein TsaE n=1 Tax=Thiolapillus brandeum TaxID=1076588 RepID=A0A831NXI8_9GAMM|nr:tRNA (adenosine(37)-N6)-threonylcarbamoyltransferase complex ATPase subunit type 1 TsaE [Thiolapillus brandeum]